MSAGKTERFARALWQSWWASVNGKAWIHRQEAIYALCCPLAKEVRYVGRAANPYVRFSHHLIPR